jgi:hypothetical protein
MADQKKENDSEVLVEWVGHDEDHSHVRVITTSDWKSVGVQDQSTVTWDGTDRATKGQALVSARAADYVLEIEKGFRKVSEGKEAFAFRS